MADRLQILRASYEAYVNTFRDEKGQLPAMMQLKLKHTMLVVEGALLIAKGEKFTEEETFVCEAAALLHDTGRYEQLKRYNTFRDSESVDHAVFSHDIVIEKGWLNDSSFDKYRNAILNAVLFHNRRDLPQGLDHLTSVASRTVRDADKLDIFRVLEDQIATTDWKNDAKAFWNLSTTKKPNPAVISAILESRPVDYQHIQSLADFVLVQIGWIRSGLEYKTTRLLCAEREHLAFRKKFLKELNAVEEADLF